MPPRTDVEFVNVVEVKVVFGQYGSVAGPEKNRAVDGTVSNWPQKYIRKSPPRSNDQYIGRDNPGIVIKPPVQPSLQTPYPE
jgi:hypothetical protein